MCAISLEKGDFDRQSITRALNRIDDLPALGRTALAQLPAVSELLARAALKDTPRQRGRILSDIIRGVIGECAMGERRETADAAEWAILYLRIHERRTIEEIAAALSMPVRSVGRYYARAKELMLNRLLAIAPAAPGAIYCPVCGAKLPVGGSDTEDNTCHSCGSHIEVTRPGPDCLTLQVTLSLRP